MVNQIRDDAAAAEASDDVEPTEENTAPESDGDEAATTVDISAEEIEKLKNRNVAVLTVMMPPGLRDEVTKAAGDDSAANWARKLFAEKLGYTLPPQSSGRARKYATDEERIAANKARATERRNTVNALLEKLKSGEISI